MIDANSKTNSFLETIKKYAEEQKNMMKEEIEAFREEQLRRANEEGTVAAYSFIQKEKSEYNSLLSKERSLKETAVKHKLFEKRKEMVDYIFDEARKKIVSYTESGKYSKYMNTTAVKLKKFIKDKKAVIYISPKDNEYENMILDVFSANCEIVCDNTIELGGIRCYCEELSIVADETLDSKFSDCQRWFVNNSKFVIE